MFQMFLSPLKKARDLSHVGAASSSGFGCVLKDKAALAIKCLWGTLDPILCSE